MVGRTSTVEAAAAMLAATFEAMLTRASSSSFEAAATATRPPRRSFKLLFFFAADCFLTRGVLRPPRPATACGRRRDVAMMSRDRIHAR